MASYDLHLHTCWSYDALAEPGLYFHRARELGMRCLAITEHHQIDSAPEVDSLAAQYPEIRVIRAAELSVTTSIGSVDLLCYNLPRDPTGHLAQILREYHEWLLASGRAKSQGLRAIGYDYTDEDRLRLLRSYHPERVIARQGAVKAMRSREIAYFRKRGFLSPDEDASSLERRIPVEFRPPPYPDAQRVVSAVKEAGGVVVIAHPPAYFLQNNPARMDALREECDLDGIECAHPEIPQELTVFYRDYCRKHQLLSTAGSDSHTPEEILSPNRFACHPGEDTWLDEFLERLPPDPARPDRGVKKF